MLKKIRSLYQPPFKYDAKTKNIVDAGNNLVADFWPDDIGNEPNEPKMRFRGWSRIQDFCRSDAGRVYDMISAFMLGVVGAEKNPLKCVDLLNKAWGHTKNEITSTDDLLRTLIDGTSKGIAYDDLVQVLRNSILDAENQERNFVITSITEMISSLNSVPKQMLDDINDAINQMPWPIMSGPNSVYKEMVPKDDRS